MHRCSVLCCFSQFSSSCTIDKGVDVYRTHTMSFLRCSGRLRTLPSPSPSRGSSNDQRNDPDDSGNLEDASNSKKQIIVIVIYTSLCKTGIHLDNNSRVTIRSMKALQPPFSARCRRWLRGFAVSFHRSASSISDDSTVCVPGRDEDHPSPLNDERHISLASVFEQAYSRLNQAECNLAEWEQRQIRLQNRLARTQSSLQTPPLKNWREWFILERQKMCQQLRLKRVKNKIIIAQQLYYQEEQNFHNALSTTSRGLGDLYGYCFSR